jgi:hypothetical protein
MAVTGAKKSMSRLPERSEPLCATSEKFEEIVSPNELKEITVNTGRRRVGPPPNSVYFLDRGVASLDQQCRRASLWN